MTFCKSIVTMAVALALLGCGDAQKLAPEEQASFSLVATAAANTGPGSTLGSSAYYFGISLNWTDASHNETEFRILRSTGSSGPFSALASTSANATSYNDEAIQPKTLYCYQVQAYQKSRLLGSSNVSCATSVDLLPPAPTNLSLSVTLGPSVQLGWQGPSGIPVSSYRVERGSSTSGPWTVLTTTAGYGFYTDNSIPLEQALCYRVFAINSYGTSPASNVPCTGVPAAPTNVAAHSVDGHTVDVTWTDASIYEDAYEIMRYGPDGNWVLIATLPANSTSYRDTGLSIDTQYLYWLRARKQAAIVLGGEVWAVTAEVPPTAPVIQSFPLSTNVVETNWPAIPRAVGYTVERSMDNGGTWATTTVSPTYSYMNVPPFIQDALNPEQVVCYRVTAYNDRGSSPLSNVSCTAPPYAPSITDAVAVDDQTVDLTWIDNSSVEDGFEIDYVEYDGLGDAYYYYIANVPANTTSYRVTGLTGSTSYDFILWALKDGGISDPSNDGYVTTLAAPSQTASARVVRPTQLPPSWRAVGARYMTAAKAKALLKVAQPFSARRVRIPLPIGEREQRKKEILPSTLR